MRYRHRATIVVGYGAFPIDMLRYDACYPLTEMDAGTIERNQQPRTSIGDRRDWKVTVERIDDDRQDPWTLPRWQSFNCYVTEVTTERVPRLPR